MAKAFLAHSARRLAAVNPTPLVLSIVLPVYNEAAVISTVLDQLEREVAAPLGSCEIIAVNDASTDETGKILDSAAARSPYLVAEHSDRNRGHGPTLIRGLSRARGEWVFHIDSDAQFVPEEFWGLWNERERADLVLGVREQRRDPFHRIVLSRLVRAAVRAMGGGAVRDPNVPFKLIGRQLLDRFQEVTRSDALAPSIMLSLAAQRWDQRVIQVPVTHLPRTHAPSTLKLWKLVRFSARGLIQLLVFSFRLRTDANRRPSGA